MPKFRYITKDFKPASLLIIGQAEQILEEYSRQGYVLTLRQLYYQFVARGLLENTQRAYKKLGSIINDARLAGEIDWDHLIDRTRNLKANSHWDTPAEIVDSAASSYRIDKWEGQSYRLEVWIEKDALVGVIERVCRRLDVPYFSCRGYTSQSEMWGAARRLLGWEDLGYTTKVIHLGDHDPSGVDMSRDIEDRLHMFMGPMASDVMVDRIALTPEQIEIYNPPPNPAKITDSRARDYILRHGHESWELDALEPRVMEDLIEETVLSYRDEEEWQERQEQEAMDRERLHRLATRWIDAMEYLEEKERGD